MSNLEGGGSGTPEPSHRHPKWQAFEIGIVPKMVKAVGELHSLSPELSIDPRSVEIVKEELFNSEAAGADKNPDNITEEMIKSAFRKRMIRRDSIDVFDM